MYHIQLVSIVIPTCKETSNIMKLVREIFDVMAETQYKYEILFVNYGNNSSTWEMISHLSGFSQFIKVVNLVGNYGQKAAIRAGFNKSMGDVILTMDGDRQYDPAYMPVFLAYIERGYDMVYGLKNTYHEGSLKPFIENTTRKFFSFIGANNIKYLGASYKAYRRQLYENYNSMENPGRLLKTDLVAKKHASVIEVPIKLRTKSAVLN
jgi:dolichol-phosphate mannosyltransferase